MSEDPMENGVVAHASNCESLLGSRALRRCRTDLEVNSTTTDRISLDDLTMTESSSLAD